MHGRVKVRSTAEQEEAKRKEREEKVKIYREITSKIYKKRSTGDLDDEALKLTKDILSQNPEIITFWNYRREILEERRKTLQPEEFAELCKKELSLLEFCLRVNPKSYGIWLHRQWIMMHSPSPDWTNEKKLCDIFLKYDERNFHCWDYRRFVISKSDNVTPKDEFDFTYEKIATNFSNYSAWHYRSKLLPVLHPSSGREGGVSDDPLKTEYELVQNAFFTDPSDQSSWFYHRWLLGKGEKPLSLACVLVQRSPQPAVCVAFNQHVRVTESAPIEIIVGETPVVSAMQSDWPESFHSFPLPSDLLSPDEIKVQVKYDILETSVLIKKDNSEVWWLNSSEEIFGSSLTVATTPILQSELDNCLELLQLEPDNKWCVLTTLHLMQALDAQKYHDEIIKMFKQLTEIDPQRQGHYSDLLSKFAIERVLRSQLATSNRTLDLSNKDLSHLFYLEYMLLIQNLDLRNNHLQSLPSKIRSLVSLTTLVLDDNQVEQLPHEVRSLKGLKVLSLRNNNISELDSLKYLQSVQTLEVLNLTGNPVCELLSQEVIRKNIKEILPRLRELDGHRND